MSQINRRSRGTFAGGAGSLGIALLLVLLLPQAASASLIGGNYRSASSPAAETLASPHASAGWTNLTGKYPTVPAARASGAMVYDAGGGYYLLFGGDNGAAVDGDTWNFTSASGWNEVSSSSGVAARAAQAMAYDSTSSEVVLFGGCEGLTNCPAGDTWTFSGGSWTQNTAGTAPSATLSGSLSDDPPDKGALMFGGCDSFSVLSQSCSGYSSGTYLFTASAGWSAVTSSSNPSARDGASLAYDPAGGYVLLFGGYTGSATLGDTWTFKGGQWTNITSTLSQSPPARSAANMFWDAGLNEMLLYGGGGVASNNLGDTWAFDGSSWTEVAASGGPAPRNGAMAAAPLSGGGPILFGGETNGSAYQADTWEFGSPLTTTATASPATVDAGQSVAFSALPSGGQPPYSYAWDFGDGTSSLLQNTSHTYATAATTPYTATLTVTDGAGTKVTKSLSVTVHALPVAQATATPSSASNGTAIAFNGTVTGGTLPFTFAWSFGDGATNATQSPSHTYPGAGNYTAKVVVTDATGVTSAASTNVTITAPPGSLSVHFTATPTSGVAPLPVTFQSTVSGGTTPYTYAWTFGDGSPGSSLADPSHTYNASGIFPVTLSMTDSSGHTGSYRLSVVVSAVGMTATATATPDQGTAPLLVGFHENVTGGQAPYSYAWTFEPGAQVSTLADPSFTFNSSGTYNVTLRVTDNPSDGKTTVAWVLVNVTAVAGLQASVQPSGCVVAGTAATFDAKVSGGLAPYNLTWAFGDGSATLQTSQTQVTHTYASPGTYELNLSVTDFAGATTSTGVAVNVVSSSGCSTGTGSLGGSATLGTLELLVFLGPLAVLAGITLLVLTFVGRGARRPPEALREESYVQ